MTGIYSTQSTPHPPKQPLYLSPDVLRACMDIDTNGIDSASRRSLLTLESLATCLTTEVVNFNQRFPLISPAGLLLRVDVLLPVHEQVNGSELFNISGGEAR